MAALAVLFHRSLTIIADRIGTPHQRTNVLDGRTLGTTLTRFYNRRLTVGTQRIGARNHGTIGFTTGAALSIGCHKLLPQPTFGSQARYLGTFGGSLFLANRTALVRWHDHFIAIATNGLAALNGRTVVAISTRWAALSGWRVGALSQETNWCFTCHQLAPVDFYGFTNRTALVWW